MSSSISMTRRRFALILPACLALFGNLGCGDDEGPPQFQVSGTVTLDGQPLEHGTISFFPQDGKGPSAAATIEGGVYTVSVTGGPKRIKIRSPQVVGERPAYEGDPNSPVVEIKQEQIPPQYNANSTLQETIKEEADDVNFILTSK